MIQRWEAHVSTEQTLSFEFKSHPIPNGRVVNVLRLGPQTPPFMEGKAIIREPGEEPDQYWVSFVPHDPVCRLRFVFDLCQSEPLAGILEKLWRAEVLTTVMDVSANENVPNGRAK